MMFLQSVVVALVGVASVVSASNSLPHNIPTCMKSCMAEANRGTACSPTDVLCLCTEKTSLIQNLGGCAASACADDKELGAGLRMVFSTCASAQAHREVLKRTSPALFRREIDYTSCQKCEDSKHQPPVVLTSVPTPYPQNLTYTNTTRPIQPTVPKLLPKSPTGAASTVAASTVSILGAIAMLAVFA